jgi:hypothetical protein
MNTAIVSHDFSATIPVQAVFSVPLPQLVRESLLQISVPDFQLCLDFPLKHFKQEMGSGKITAAATVDEDLSLVLALTGKLIEGEATFRSEKTSLEIEITTDHAQAYFVASTLWAMFGLAKQVHIQTPGGRLDFPVVLSLSEISLMLRCRQIAYWLMVIERATGKEFSVPPNVSDAEREEIAFVYRAIIDRSFVWAIETVQVTISATSEGFAQLPLADHPVRHQLDLGLVHKNLLGQSLTLGNGTMVIEDMIVQNIEEVRREAALGDGHPVKMMVRSLTGQARFDLLEAPRLLDEPWDERIQQLVNLESQLDACLAERYHALAAATLAGLTEEEKKEITARPELDGSAFPITDEN